MTTVVFTHSVGSLDTWLAGGHRKDLFAKFCDSYKLFKHASDPSRISIVCKGVDLAKMETVLGSKEADRAKADDTVKEPVDIFIEIEGAQ